jgi:hypothetical protein
MRVSSGGFMAQARRVAPRSSDRNPGGYLGWPARYWVVLASTVFAIVVAWELLDIYLPPGHPGFLPTTTGTWVVVLAGLLGEALFLTAIAMLIVEACLMATRSRHARAGTA